MDDVYKLSRPMANIIGMEKNGRKEIPPIYFAPENG